LRKLITVPWVFENNTDEVAYNNTRNLALGIYLDQFTKLVANLNENNIKYYEKILRKFLVRNIEKARLLEPDNTTQRRGNNNLRAQRQVVDVLNSMGYGPQAV
jgi:hypothetical protein